MTGQLCISDGDDLASETTAKSLRRALRPYTGRSNRTALALFFGFYSKLLVLIALALYIDNFWLQMACSIAAGAAISSLFVIGHDAAHGSFTSSTRLSALLGRLAMLPALHNFTLWRIVHNRMHHSDTCVRGINSWSPLSKAEYDRLSPIHKGLARFYRTPLGLGIYYIFNRWLPEKFIPPVHLRDTRIVEQWLDFGLLLVFLSALGIFFWFVSSASSHLSYAQAWIYGFVLPFVTWNYLMGFTVYLQHTHPTVPWFRSVEDARRAGAQQHELSVQIVFPKWFGWISNNIMEHPAHHVNTKVPLYHLAQAQAHLNTLVSSSGVTQRFTPRAFLDIMRHCKLYDYDDRRWLGFDGEPSDAWSPPKVSRNDVNSSSCSTSKS